METSKSTKFFVDWFLKIGIILFIGSVLFEILIQLKPDNEFWFWTLRIFLVALFAGLTVVIVALGRMEYYIFGFFLTFIASLYKIINILNVTSGYTEIPVFILLIAVSVYFLTKSSRSHQHHN